MEESRLLDDIETVDYVLKHANEHGLQSEVVTTAMKYLQDHTGASIEDALKAGLAAWDLLF